MDSSPCDASDICLNPYTNLPEDGRVPLLTWVAGGLAAPDGNPSLFDGPVFLEVEEGKYLVIQCVYQAYYNQNSDYSLGVPGQIYLLAKVNGQPASKVISVDEDGFVGILDNESEFYTPDVAPMTLEEIVEAWPAFSKYVEETPPVGLSATKKHFIRVI